MEATKAYDLSHLAEEVCEPCMMLYHSSEPSYTLCKACRTCTFCKRLVFEEEEGNWKIGLKPAFHKTCMLEYLDTINPIEIARA